MKRRDVVRSLLTPETVEGSAEAVTHRARVPSTAVRAMGLEIGRLADEARAAESLRNQIEGGTYVVEIDPAVVEPSFVSDRFSRTADKDYRRLLESIRDYGQQLPILVRPHPEKAGYFQIAFGHRRREVAAELGVPVRAVVRNLSNEELVVAQGKENAERRDLSFIERALFAAELERSGFSRATLNAALGVHTTEMTRLLGVAAAVPASIVRAIGPAPKAGRPRWVALARCLDRRDAVERIERLLQQPSFQNLSSDGRFDRVLDMLRAMNGSAEPELVRNSRGDPIIRVERFGKTVRFIVDERLAPDFGDFLKSEMADLLRKFEAVDCRE